VKAAEKEAGIAAPIEGSPKFVSEALRRQIEESPSDGAFGFARDRVR